MMLRRFRITGTQKQAGCQLVFREVITGQLDPAPKVDQRGVVVFGVDGNLSGPLCDLGVVRNLGRLGVKLNGFLVVFIAASQLSGRNEKNGIGIFIYLYTGRHRFIGCGVPLTLGKWHTLPAGTQQAQKDCRPGPG